MRLTIRRASRAAPLLAVLACLSLAGWATAQTDAGTLIVNQARAVIRDEVVIPSNQVTTVVQAVCGVRVLPLAESADHPAQSFTVVHGGSAVVPFRVVNVGNATQRFELEPDAGSGAWTPLGMRVYHDLDGSARRDAGDPLVTDVTLDARQHEAFVLVVDAPDAGAGTLDVSLAVRCAASGPPAPGAALEASTSARLRLDDRTAPAVTPRLLLTEQPGEPGDPRRARATIELTNYGGADPGAVELFVALDAVAPCLTFDPGALPPHGVHADDADVSVRTADGWQSLAHFAQRLSDGDALASDALELRVRRSGLAEGQRALVHVGLLLDEPTCADVVSLTAQVRTSEHESHAVGHLPIARRPASALRYVPDPGVHPHLIVGHTRCFDFELTNVGGVDDVYTMALEHDLPAEDAPSVRVSLRSRADLPLDAEIGLAPGERRIVRACVTADDPIDAFELSLRAHSRAGAPVAHASVSVGAALRGDGVTAVLSADPASVVVAGGVVRFDAVLRNALPIELSEVRARFEVLTASAPDGTPEHLPFVWFDGDDGVAMEPETGIVRWHLASLPAGGEHRARFTLRARDDLPDDTRIDTLVRARASELGDAVQSDTVRHTVWSSELLATLQVQPEQVYPGDRLTLTVRVTNPSDRPIVATVMSTAPEGARPLSASGDRPAATTDDEAPDTSDAEPADDPSATELWLPAGGVAHATFVLRVGADPSDPLRGRVRVTGVSDAGTDAGRVDLDYAVPVERGPFAREHGVLVGHVFADLNGDGRYHDPSAGLAGVRVLLPDGRQTRSDAHGRFAFRDVPVGWWRVQFDPATLPSPLAASPTRVGPSAHRVLVQGVTRLDVPVEPISAHARIERSTELRMGPLSVVQHESPLGGMTLRTVELRTSEPLAGVVLRWHDDDGVAREWRVGRLEERAERAFVVPNAAAGVDPEVTWQRE